MGRREDGSRVEVLQDRRTGRSTELRLIKNTMTFFVVIDHERFENKDGDVVRKWATARLAQMQDITWVPVVHIEIRRRERSWRDRSNENDAIVARCEFEAVRWYVARLPNGVWRRLEWDDYSRLKNHSAQAIAESQKFEHADDLQREQPDRDLAFPLLDVTGALANEGKSPSKRDRYNHDDVEHWLPYSEQVWDGFRKIATVVENERKALNAMLGHVDVVARLTALSHGGPMPLMIAASSVAARDVEAVTRATHSTQKRRRSQ